MLARHVGCLQAQGLLGYCDRRGGRGPLAEGARRLREVGHPKGARRNARLLLRRPPVGPGAVLQEAHGAPLLLLLLGAVARRGLGGRSLGEGLERGVLGGLLLLLLLPLQSRWGRCRPLLQRHPLERLGHRRERVTAELHRLLVLMLLLLGGRWLLLQGGAAKVRGTPEWYGRRRPVLLLLLLVLVLLLLLPAAGLW